MVTFNFALRNANNDIIFILKTLTFYFTRGPENFWNQRMVQAKEEEVNLINIWQYRIHSGPDPHKILRESPNFPSNTYVGFTWYRFYLLGRENFSDKAVTYHNIFLPWNLSLYSNTDLVGLEIRFLEKNLLKIC